MATREELLAAAVAQTGLDDFGDDSFREGLEPESRAALADELAELYAALDEAREVLTDEALHSAYLGQLGEGSWR